MLGRVTFQIGSWWVSLGRHHGRTQRKGERGGLQLHGGGVFQAEEAAGAKVLWSGVPGTFGELHGIQSSFLVGWPPNYPLVGASVHGAHPGHHCILGLFQHLTPGQKLNQCQQDPK